MMESASQDSRKMLETLRVAVNKALEKKKRLGQYAVVWKDGKPVILKDSDIQGSSQVQSH